MVQWAGVAQSLCNAPPCLIAPLPPYYFVALYPDQLIVADGHASVVCKTKHDAVAPAVRMCYYRYRRCQACGG
ncbi:hypothetical protein RB195_004789 [Necator americanus]|uniref:Sema domain-containing protein n=1 Tax=Necator americanus TaxID=51031 RepID=A0ABR1BNJ2_NECAM